MESQSLCTDNPIKTQDQKENVFPDRDYEQRIQRESFDSWFNDTILVSKEGEMMAFQFDPTDGLLNGNVFPTVPESETAARQQFQTLLNQIRDAINAHLAESVQDTGGVHGLEYEEGTWSPILFAENGQVDVTLYSTTNSYVRIGNLVFIRGEISIDTYSKGTGAGRIEVAGLPFTPAESATMAVRAHSLTTPDIDIMAAGVGNTIVFTKSPATTTTLFDYIGVDDIKNRSRFYLSGTYRI
jgi:hypothetical protein